MSALWLRTLVVSRRQQSSRSRLLPIREVGWTVSTLVGAIVLKVSHNLSSCYPPRARKLLVLLLTILLHSMGSTSDSLLSVACNSDSEIRASYHSRQQKLSIPEDIVLTPINFRCSRLLVGPGKVIARFLSRSGFLLVWVAGFHDDDDVTRWPLGTSLWPRTRLLVFDMSMVDLLCHRSFYSCKDNTGVRWMYESALHLKTYCLRPCLHY